MAVTPTPSTVRVDSWTWSVRLYPSRSAASTACTAGHVKVNGNSVKPAHAIKVGDTVRALTRGGERIVVVTGLLTKRVAASVAVQNYDDQTPLPPPKTERSSPITRDPGAGRPTKRDRRQIEQLRGR